MKAKKIDFPKLNESVEKFGSLQKVNAQLGKDKLALEKGNAQLKQENKNLAATRDKLAGQVEGINTKKEDYQSQLQSLSNKIKTHSYQYELFCGFMAMVAESPSVTDSLKTLVASLQKLIDSGWHISKNADEMRSLFVRTVMGDYLKCYRCGSCGAKFITNKEPKYKFFGNGYYCPSCHDWYAVKEDDSLENVADHSARSDRISFDAEPVTVIVTFLLATAPQVLARIIAAITMPADKTIANGK